MKPTLALLTFALAIGCSGSLSEEKYLEEWSKACRDFNSTAQEVGGVGPPSSKGLPRAERLKVLADKLDRDAVQFKLVADRLQALKPPDKYKTLHEKTLRLLQLSHTDLTEAAVAIRAGDSAKASELMSGQEARLMQAMDEMSAEAQRLALTMPDGMK